MCVYYNQFDDKKWLPKSLIKKTQLTDTHLKAQTHCMVFYQVTSIKFLHFKIVFFLQTNKQICMEKKYFHQIMMKFICFLL